MANYADADLLDMLQGGSPAERDKALKAVYKGAYKMIESMIIKNNGSAADAEDIFHDGLISFYKQAQKGLTLTCKVNTYMYSICRNLWLARLRKAGRSDRLDDNYDVVELDSNPEDHLVKDDCSGLVAKTLGLLGDDCKKVIVLSYFDQYSATEVADAMGYANSQVARNRKSGCLKKFRELVINEGHSNGALRQCLEAYF